MCQECGCGIKREVHINGQPGSSIPSPLAGTASPSSTEDHRHNHPHDHGHSNDHEHEHIHVHADGMHHSHSHLHPHQHPHSSPSDSDPLHDHSHSHEHAHSHDHDHAASESHAHTHGPASSGHTIMVNQAILSHNDRLAERNRGFFQAKGIVAVNVLSSPGSGKTTLIQETLNRLGSRLKSAVIVGDLATDNDARRLRATGVPVVQVTTGTVCHLDAEMIAKSLTKLELEAIKLLIIENVGNLVCPAAYDLGEALRVVVLSVTEGEDKPLKYPPLFSSAHAAIISKTDLSEAAGFQRDQAIANLRRVNPQARILELSARTGQGMEAWCDFLLRHMDAPVLP